MLKFMNKLLIGVALLSAAVGGSYAVASVEVGERPAPTVTIYAQPAEIAGGQTSTLTWFSRNATSCYGSGAWSGSKARNGTKDINPNTTSIYELTCRGRGGTTSASVTVIVSNVEDPEVPDPEDPPPPPPPNPSAPPTCTLTSNKYSVLVNEAFVLSWTTTNADYIGDVGGKNNPSGFASTSVSVAGPFTYAITAYGAGGSATCSVTIAVNEPTSPPAASCPSYSRPICSGGAYVTTGPSDSNGCLGAPRCTLPVLFGAPNYLSSSFVNGSVSVMNAGSVPLPKSLGAVPAVSGVKNYAAGAAFLLESGAEYGGGVTGQYSVIAYPPTSTADFTKITYAPNQDTNRVQRLKATIGLSPVVPSVPAQDGSDDAPEFDRGGEILDEALVRGATYGGSVRVTISASADKIDAKDQTSQIIYDNTLTPTNGSAVIDIPLGIWGMRQNLKFDITVRKALSDSLQYGAVFSDFRLEERGLRPEMSMVRNDIMWAPETSWNLIIGALAKFPVTHIHESIRTTGSSWFQAPLLKRVQDQGKKITLVVGPLTEDLADGKSVINTPRCSWPTFKHSEMSFEKYEKRLRANLDQYKKSGVEVVSVEVGNELDLYCFGSADIPTDRAPTDADYKLFTDTYSKFLERTVSIVKRPEYYPSATIILGAPAIDWSPATGKLDHNRMYQGLKNHNGRNYFDLVDGIGIHLYPFVGKEHESVQRAKSYLAAIGESERPVWVTEWGYANSQYASGDAPEKRYASFRSFYDAMLGISEFRVTHLAHYMLDDFNLGYTVVGGDYNLLSEARFFSQYRTPGTLATASRERVLACVGCTSLFDWLDEFMNNMRDAWFTLRGN